LTRDRIEEWNQRYRSGAQVFDTPAPLVVDFAGKLAPGSALDLASGAGRNALYLAGRNWRVTAVDGSEAAVELLRARAQERGVAIETRVADLEDGSFDVPSESFDLVLSCYYLQRSLIPLMQRALRPGGRLILIAHLADADQPRGSKTRAFSGELPGLFPGWRILHYREGAPGESCHRRAVAELVAEKPAS
jgi:SAM-dependent methyltransferase